VFSANTAGYEGGAIYCDEESAPTITNCTFSSNTALTGGAVCMWNSGAEFSGCMFTSNAAETSGGAVWSYETTGLTFTNSTFSDNAAAYGGALSCPVGSVTITACAFNDNSANAAGSSPSGGGAVYGYDATLSLTDCVFSGNLSLADGGAIHSNFCALTLSGCACMNNTAAGNGGALYSDAGYPTLEYCIIYTNEAVLGGGLYANEGYPTLRSCTLYGNVATTGGGIYNGPFALLTVEQTIVAASSAGQALACDAAVMTAPALSCCNFFGNAGGDWDDGMIADQLGESGNIALDPEFCSPVPHEHDNWALQSDSPCAPEQSVCGLIGAVEVGCEDTPVRASSWGGIKALFLDER
jgi:predicted outer membrane repeat protein